MLGRKLAGLRFAKPTLQHLSWIQSLWGIWQLEGKLAADESILALSAECLSCSNHLQA